MVPRPYTVLAELADRYQASGEPVAVSTLAASLDTTEAALAEPLATLREFELATETDEGYRPTVTAHELLELDVDLGDVIVLDFVEE